MITIQTMRMTKLPQKPKSKVFKKPQACGNKFGVLNHVWIQLYISMCDILKQTI